MSDLRVESGDFKFQSDAGLHDIEKLRLVDGE